MVLCPLLLRGAGMDHGMETSVSGQGTVNPPGQTGVLEGSDMRVGDGGALRRCGVVSGDPSIAAIPNYYLQEAVA